MCHAHQSKAYLCPDLGNLCFKMIVHACITDHALSNDNDITSYSEIESNNEMIKEI